MSMAGAADDIAVISDAGYIRKVKKRARLYEVSNPSTGNTDKNDEFIYTVLNFRIKYDVVDYISFHLHVSTYS